MSADHNLDRMRQAIRALGESEHDFPYVPMGHDFRVYMLATLACTVDPDTWSYAIGSATDLIQGDRARRALKAAS